MRRGADNAVRSPWNNRSPPLPRVTRSDDDRSITGQDSVYHGLVDGRHGWRALAHYDSDSIPDGGAGIPMGGGTLPRMNLAVNSCGTDGK